MEADNTLFLPDVDSNNVKHRFEQSCHLNNGACTSFSDLFGRISVEVTPNNFPAFKPLSVKVTVENHLVNSIEVYLQGKDMFMGPNSTLLNNNGQGRWSGNTVIPVCSVDTDMTWLVNIMVQGDESELLIFEIKSAANNAFQY